MSLTKERIEDLAISILAAVLHPNAEAMEELTTRIACDDYGFNPDTPLKLKRLAEGFREFSSILVAEAARMEEALREIASIDAQLLSHDRPEDEAASEP